MRKYIEGRLTNAAVRNYESNGRMKVFLDDERIAPDGWIQTRWPDEVISLLKSGNVTNLSLDHDLGDDQHGTGYDVLLWIEQEVALHRFVPPEITIHTANPAARQRMLEAIESIGKIRLQN